MKLIELLKDYGYSEMMKSPTDESDFELRLDEPWYSLLQKEMCEMIPYPFNNNIGIDWYSYNLMEMRFTIRRLNNAEGMNYHTKSFFKFIYDNV